jgi:hypothetical protein
MFKHTMRAHPSPVARAIRNNSPPMATAPEARATPAGANWCEHPGQLADTLIDSESEARRSAVAVAITSCQVIPFRGNLGL